MRAPPVMTPAPAVGADRSISSFDLLRYIREQAETHSQDLNGYIPNPFAGATTIQEIQASPEKQRALTTVVQFVHHYVRHLV